MNENRISKTAVIMPDVTLGRNIIIQDNVIIGSGSIIGDGTEIGAGVIVGENCVIGIKCIVKERTIIGDNVILGEGVYLDYDVVFRDNVTIGDFSVIGCRSILGEYLVDFYSEKKNTKHLLSIGKKALIRSEAIIYGSTTIDDDFQTGHRVTIREYCTIGKNVRIGTLADIQGHCEIQEYVNIHSNVHIGQKSIIKKYAWLFPYVILTNDPNPPSESLQGVTIEEFAVVCTGTIILPGIVIGKESLIGAGAIVTKSVGESLVAVGNPAKIMGSTEKIKDKVTGNNIYPWKNTFDRGMPWQNIGYEEWEKGNRDENNAKPS